MSDSIPKVLHQTWKTDVIPPEWVRYVASWASTHPGWEYRLWTDAANRAFVAEHYPALLPRYDGFAYGIQRADAIRYCLLHHFGGVYVDMDIECLQAIDPLIEGHELVTVREPEGQGKRLGRASLFSNAFMASRPGHPVLAAVIDRLIRDSKPAVTHTDVLETTGPLMLDSVLAAYTGNDLHVLPSEAVFPFEAGTNELEQLRTGDSAGLRATLVQRGTYAVHYWANTWVGTLAGELINPHPHDVPGYDFFPGFDSPGHDIANVGRDVMSAAAACDRIGNGLAFNTDGFVKGYLLPREQWSRFGDTPEHQGLYVKRQGAISRLQRLWRGRSK